MAVHVAPLVDALLADNDDVSEHVEASQRSAQPHRLASPAFDRRLNHQEVEVAVLPGFAAGVRPE